MKTFAAVFLAVLATFGVAIPVFAQGTAFTYQGRLYDEVNPANGTYDLTFSVWSVASGPPQASSTVTNLATVVSNGAPTLAITPTTPGFVIISWSPSTPGFVLQESLSLSPISWANSPSGATNPIVVPAMVPTKLYRLGSP